jgi:hypothetical protein
MAPQTESEWAAAALALVTALREVCERAARETSAPTAAGAPVAPLCPDSPTSAGDDSDASSTASGAETWLQTCPRAHADRAGVIKRALKQKLGKAQARVALSGCREAVMRVQKFPQRVLLDARGETLCLAPELRPMVC